MMILGRLILLILLPLTAGAETMVNPTPDLDLFLPRAIDGWEINEPDQHHTGDDLYKYINGGAELYVSYGVKNVWSRVYGKPDEPDIMVDIFEMSSSQDAFGVFSHARETVDEPFGQGSQYTAGLFMFWKERFFISLLASPETADSKTALTRLARSIEEAIPAPGPLPAVLDLLPAKDLVEESVKYFTHHVWLNSFYFVADENILHLDRSTPAVLARYGEKGNRSILLIVRYPDPDKSKSAYGDFTKYYLPELAQGPVAQIEDGTWSGSLRHDEVLVVVFNAASRETALELMESVPLDPH